MIHPDTWFETHRHEQNERTNKSIKNLAKELQNSNESSLKDKVLENSGELFIRVGNKLKGSAQRPYQQQPQLIK